MGLASSIWKGIVEFSTLMEPKSSLNVIKMFFWTLAPNFGGECN